MRLVVALVWDHINTFCSPKHNLEISVNVIYPLASGYLGHSKRIILENAVRAYIYFLNFARHKIDTEQKKYI